ncbi:hypothetical protein NTGZN8_340024 [Candidatus Nitrotoga fabula]|uniref:Uncharacterized protein n=1 Tax=Candidatus Nitrotoga fabula TaxID=2182327 RepID=A0A916BCZ0_9PROT|nr:hypothetical protein NTGZN8_340024 [Candidatus Nitrotoga fabula]
MFGHAQGLVARNSGYFDEVDASLNQVDGGSVAYGFIRVQACRLDYLQNRGCR